MFNNSNKTCEKLARREPHCGVQVRTYGGRLVGHAQHVEHIEYLKTGDRVMWVEGRDGVFRPR